MIGIISVGHPKFIEVIAELMHLEFNVARELAAASLRFKLQAIINCLRSDLSVFVETDYVDRVYRDSYYSYFSSKADCISRDCIRLSFLDNSSGVFSEKGALDYDQYDDVRKNYLGFVVIRPTIPAVIGRSAISPKALKVHDFKCCLVPINTTVNGFKVQVDAFPFSSQDRETITCAETTLWALMEYYGNKYPEYKPVNPSDILRNLESCVACRQLPSNGLTAENLTFALKTFGFGPQIYAVASFGSSANGFLSCYVESGIPVIVAISNATAVGVKQRINHAVLCVGHEDISHESIDAALAKHLEILNSNGGVVNVLDFDNIEKRFVFIDDNCPPYQKDFLSTPANRYQGQSDWNACRISNFVAPLYKRIYMEPFLAKQYVRQLLSSGYYSHLKGGTVVVRTYLCSTRSFRHYVNESTMTGGMKDVISGLFMPKFVWITEVSRVDNFKKGLVDYLIVIDATSYETSNFSPLLVAFVDNACYRKDPKDKTLGVCKVPTAQFTPYSNLK